MSDIKSENQQQLDQLSPLKKALYAVEEMKAKLDALKREKSEPIAVIGIACSFPHAKNHRIFWQNLLDGVDAISSVPEDRWSNDQFYSATPGENGKISSRFGGFIDEIDKFDPQFFGISPREAVSMDPQQRLLLQTSWHALEDAGLKPSALQKSRTGVFVGISGNDYTQVMHENQDAHDIDAYAGSGNAMSIAANRLSYFYDFIGPSIAVDTACSSSLTAVHLAVKSLRSRETDMAVAGGVNVILSPYPSITFSQAHMLAPGGRCRTFDASAEGYVRGEGCGIIILKRLRDAVQDGDPILAVVRGTAINQDGRTNGLTAPNSLAQVRVIEGALQDAGLAASQIDYIETHGTGTILGDPIEVEAIAQVMKNRPIEKPVYIGSVKTNIGHLEASAGIAGIIKTVLALKHGIIPPHLHFKTANPHIPLDRLPICVPTEKLMWETNGDKKRAGVSSFGFGGTNAHIIFEEAPVVAPKAESHLPTVLFTLSGREETVLSEYVRDYIDFLQNSQASLADMAHTLLTGREHFHHRLAVIAATREELVEKLTAKANDQAAGFVFEGAAAERGGKAFLFTGQGAQYVGMGRELYDLHPTFRAALDEINDLSQQFLSVSILSIMWDEKNPELIHRTQYTQPALFAIEYALAKMWLAMGVKPDYVMGHSIGEIVAACIAGVFSPADAFQLVAIRAQLMGSLPDGGGMAAVFAAKEWVLEQLREFPALQIAGVNGPQNVVLSGPEASLNEFLIRCEKFEVQVRKLNVSHAFHSDLMQPILNEFKKSIASLHFSAPTIPLVSNVSGKLFKPGEIPDASYWCNHIRQSVLFLDSILELAQRKVTVFLEIGPNPHLSGMGRRCLPQQKALWVGSLKDDKKDSEAFLESVATLYVNGVEFDLNALAALWGGRFVQLSNYPFKRDRYWIEKKEQKSRGGRHHLPTNGKKVHPLLGYELSSPLSSMLYQNHLNGDPERPIEPAILYDQKIFPHAAFVEMGNAAARQLFKDLPYSIEFVQFRDELVLNGDNQGIDLQVVVSPEDNGKKAVFKAYSYHSESPSTGWQLHVEGKIIQEESAVSHILPTTPADIKKKCRALTVEAIYEELKSCGAKSDDKSRLIAEGYIGQEIALTRLQIPEGLQKSLSQYTIHPRLIDACWQTLCLLKPDKTQTFLPASIKRQVSIQNDYHTLWCYAEVVKRDADAFTGQIYLLDEQGDVHTFIEGMRFAGLSEEKKKLWQKPVVEKKAADAGVEQRTIGFSRQQWESASSDERVQLIQTYLQAQLAQVLNLKPAQISLSLSITHFGLDSIMALELQNRIDRDINIKLPVAQLIVGPTIVQLADLIVEKWQQGAADQSIQPLDGMDYGEFSLSAGQKAMWVQHQMAPKSIFNPVYAVRIRGDVKVDGLYQALQKIVNRHPALRTTFHYKNGEQIQKVHEYMDVHLNIVDAADWSEEKLQQHIEDVAIESYDLVRGPLFKCFLITKSADDFIIIIAAHHIIIDMWSLAVVVNELAQLYVDPEKNLLPLRLRYTDFVAWQNKMLASAEGEKLWSYWLEKLSGHLSMLELPLDMPRPAVQTFKGRNISLRMGDELSRRLQEFSDEQGVTLYTTLLAAFKVLLSKCTGQEDIIVGTPTTGRSRPELMDTVGYFVNSVALRSHVDRRQSFVDLLQQVRKTVVEAIDHQDYSLYHLVERLMPVRDISRTPLFQVMFVYQRAHLLNDSGLSSIALGLEGEEMQFAGLPLSAISINEQVSPFDMTFMIAEGKEGLAATLTYNVDLFTEETIQRWLEQYKTLLDQIVESPTSSIAQMNPVPYAELYQVLFGWNDTLVPLPEDRLIQSLFEEQAKLHADDIAVDFEGQQLTYAELDERANKLGQYLRHQGINNETIVGLCVDRSLEMVVGLLGILKAGGAYLPLDPYYPKDRLQYMIEHSGVKVVLTVTSLLENLPVFSGTTVYLDQQWPAIILEKNETPERTC
ncbi:MAG: acyltransferase domain-containing protein, partial [Calditrichaeota bacterium]